MRSPKILAGVAILALASPLAVAQATPNQPSPLSRFVQGEAPAKIDRSFVPAILDSNRMVKVMIEMADDPVAVVESKADHKLNASEKSNIRKALKNKQDAVAAKVKASGGKVVSQMQDAYNGMQVRVKPSELNALAAAPGVTALKPVPTAYLDNSVSVPYLGSPKVWNDTGYTGKNVKVAIIDTGIDYTHAAFAGPGTVEAYQANKETADPALFGPNSPRVKGGYDFVGDAYTGDNDPVPDANPLDCHGHGTHVAGTTASGGVLADGTAYTGPYTSAALAGKQWKVGPGNAPNADLYALRVFGCTGSTDVATEAIDWAVANGMDVINMSLGSSYGTADDPSAIAATNAVAAGVVVVTSAGNSGPNPYLTGSPGVGYGVVGVAANDSTASFPGTIINVDGTEVEAINANGAPIPSGSFDVVVLADDPNTPENEALGCSLAAYQSNGVTASGNQLAVSQRGACARVAKAIFAQQAGAKVAVMVNNAPNLPPYEGAILENPDDGTPYEVTIPFLGVKQTDGPTLAAGQTASLSERELENPGFKAPSNFTSGGPRSSDSGLSPNIVAPGVAISSAAVGSGTGAAIMSGTSMAAPQVAGIAALNVEAHPTWSGQEIAANLVNTADASAVKDYRLTLAGTGQVDAQQSVANQVIVYGDTQRATYNGKRIRVHEPTISFGFTENSREYRAIERVTVVNKGSKTAVFTVGTKASPQSVKARVTPSTRYLRVAPGRSASFLVSIRVAARDVPGTEPTQGDPFRLFEASGHITLTGQSGNLSVPYLMVPRSSSDLRVQAPVLPLQERDPNLDVRLSNGWRASVSANADFYQWGLSDPRDVRFAGAHGVDVRAAGVQSFDLGSDHLLVFAINTWDRASNAAETEYDVAVDTNGDGTPDWVVLSVDFGLVAAGNTDGTPGVFLYELATKRLLYSGFNALAPTDNSTILLPLLASDIGLSNDNPAFVYTVATSSIVNSAIEDSVAAAAAYSLTEPAIANGMSAAVAPGKRASVKVGVDLAAHAVQQPLGVMVVAFDQPSGRAEAQLVDVRVKTKKEKPIKPLSIKKN